MSHIAAPSLAQYVTAFFDNRDDAQTAVDRLVAEGVDKDDIRMVAGNQSSSTSETGVTASGTTGDKGFFGSLGDLFMPDEDRHTYAEGLRRGGYLVSLPTTAANRERILDILDDEGTIDIDERAETWRSEGWSGQDSGDIAGAVRTPVVAAGASASADRDETIEVMEERLRVGKRDVSQGRVRVRSYVVEEPVSENVSLRSERVDIERRPVDRAVSSLDAAFTERTIEVEETAEEAVVSKTARVVEEIDLKTTVADRVETVSDTVRRTEVEIEDERTGKATLTDEAVTTGDRARRGL